MYYLQYLLIISYTMATDYYSILSIPFSASTLDVCNAYRQLALQWHPTLSHTNPNHAYHQFCAITQAFQVLYDPAKRKYYDEFGAQALKESTLGKSSSEPEDTFQKFFGTRNVYQHLMDAPEGVSAKIFTAQYPEHKEAKQTPHLVVAVPCLLSELFNGCKKTVSYKKKVLSEDGKSSREVEEVKIVDIVPGANKPIVFPGLGHCEPGVKPSNLVVEIVPVNEKNYQKQGDDLVYTATITLMQALDSIPISIVQFNKQVLNVHFDQIIAPQTKRVIEGKGMPRENEQSRGNLIVQFNIKFPEELELSDKEKIVKLLKQCQEN